MRLLIGLTCVLVLLCLAGCGGGAASPAPEASGKPSLGPVVSLPVPSEFSKEASAPDPRFATGSAYLGGYAQNITDVMTAAAFAASWEPGHMNATDTAYAVYQLDLSGYDGLDSAYLAWDAAPAEGLVYLGLADFPRDRWEWHAMPSSAHLSFVPTTHISGSGMFLLAVVSLDTVTRQLNFVRIGDDLKPQPALAADVRSGIAPLAVNLSAAGSMDLDGAIVKYEFDPLGDGSWVDHGSNPDYAWTYTTYGAYTAGVRVTDDNGNTATADIQIGAGWEHSWGGTGYEEGLAMAADADGNIHVLGLTTSFGQGANEVLLLKYDPAGNLLWQKTFGTVNGDSPCGLVLDTDSNIYIAGSRLEPATFDFKPFICSLSPAGTLRWQKYWEMPSDTEARGMAYDGSTGIYLTMMHQFPAPTEPQVLYLKVSTADGSQQWAFDWGGDKMELPFDLAVDEAGNGYLALTSTSFSGDGSNNCVVLSFDSAGTVSSSFAFGLGELEQPQAISVANGLIYLATQELLACITTAGSVEWQYQPAFASLYGIQDLVASADGCFAVGSFQNPGFADGFVLDFDPAGVLLDSKQIVYADQHCTCYGLASGPAGGVYFTGRTPDATAGWEDLALGELASPACTVTGVSATATASGISNHDFSGVLADVPGGTPVLDTGGGTDDALVGFCFPW